MNKYYVVEFIIGGDEWNCGKFESLEEAIKQARLEWSRLTRQEKKNHNIEVRQYEDDIEVDNYSNFDYNDFDWGYQIRGKETQNNCKTIEEAEDVLWGYVKDKDEPESEMLKHYEVIDCATNKPMDIYWDEANEDVVINVD